MEADKMRPECQFCSVHSEHERAIAVHDKRLDEHSRKMDEHQKEFHEMREKQMSDSMELKNILDRLSSIEEQNQRRIDEMEDRLAAIEAKPAQAWNKTVTIVATAIITGVVTLLVDSVVTAVFGA